MSEPASSLLNGHFGNISMASIAAILLANTFGLKMPDGTAQAGQQATEAVSTMMPAVQAAADKIDRIDQTMRDMVAVLESVHKASEEQIEVSRQTYEAMRELMFQLRMMRGKTGLDAPR